MNKLLLPLLLLATQPAESELKKLPENSIVVAEKILFSEVVLKLLAANEGRLEDGDCILTDQGKEVEISCKQ